MKILFKRLESKEIKEVILATSITTSGQTTAHYLLNNIKKLDIKVSRLARGVPAGGELDYLDEATCPPDDCHWCNLPSIDNDREDEVQGCGICGIFRDSD